MKMPCIFCRNEAQFSQSQEHIIPESLGNIDHILPKGVVCDKCNNYFARKIEGPLLEDRYFRYIRSQMMIENKKGNIPPIDCIIPGVPTGISLWKNGEGLRLEAKNENLQNLVDASIREMQRGAITFLIPEGPDRRLMSRFLGKVAMEALAARVSSVEGWREELLSTDELEPLRRYVRFGGGSSEWNFSDRLLYHPNKIFNDESESYEIIHEFDFLYTEDCHLFFIVAFFGREFAIDMSNQNIARYSEWLAENNGRSPLAPW